VTVIRCLIYGQDDHTRCWSARKSLTLLAFCPIFIAKTNHFISVETNCQNKFSSLTSLNVLAGNYLNLSGIAFFHTVAPLMTGQLIYCGENGHRTVAVQWLTRCYQYFSVGSITLHLSAANTFLYLVFAVPLSTCQKPIKMQSSAAWLGQIESLERNNGMATGRQLRRVYSMCQCQ